jgi:hypothetical protein
LTWEDDLENLPCPIAYQVNVDVVDYGNINLNGTESSAVRSKKFHRPNVLESQFPPNQFSLPSPPHSHWTWEVYHIDRLPSLNVNTANIFNIGISLINLCNAVKCGSAKIGTGYDTRPCLHDLADFLE